MSALTGASAHSGELGKSRTPNAAVLTRKNILLKKRQYLQVCKCFCLPCPFAIVMEFIIPCGIIVFISYLKTLTGENVQAHSQPISAS